MFQHTSCVYLLRASLDHVRENENDHSSSQSSKHKGLTCPEGQSAWPLVPSSSGEMLASSKKNVLVVFLRRLVPLRRKWACANREDGGMCCTVLVVVFYGRAKMCLGIYVKREDRPPYYIKFHVCVMCVGGRNTSQGQDKTRSHKSPHVHNNVKSGNCASCDALGHLKTIRCVHAQVPTCTGARKRKKKKKLRGATRGQPGRRRQEHNLAGDTVDQHLH